MAQIICDPSIAASVAKCEVVQKLDRCCDAFGADGFSVESLSQDTGAIRLLGRLITWDAGHPGEYRAGRLRGSLDYLLDHYFTWLRTKIHLPYGEDRLDLCVYIINTCPTASIIWSDPHTGTEHKWYHTDLEAVGMAAAACRQPENAGIYLDWLEDRLGVVVRDRDEMMRYVCEKQDAASAATCKA